MLQPRARRRPAMRREAAAGTRTSVGAPGPWVECQADDGHTPATRHATVRSRVSVAGTGRGAGPVPGALGARGRDRLRRMRPGPCGFRGRDPTAAQSCVCSIDTGAIRGTDVTLRSLRTPRDDAYVPPPGWVAWHVRPLPRDSVAVARTHGDAHWRSSTVWPATDPAPGRSAVSGPRHGRARPRAGRGPRRVPRSPRDLVALDDRPRAARRRARRGGCSSAGDAHRTRRAAYAVGFVGRVAQHGRERQRRNRPTLVLS